MNVLLFLLLAFRPLFSHHKIYSPIVEEGRQSIEWRGHFDVDDRVEKNKAHHHVLKQNIHGQVFGKVSWSFIFLIRKILLWIGRKQSFRINYKFLIIKIGQPHYIFRIMLFQRSDKADEIEYKYLNQFYNDTFGFISTFIFEKEVGRRLLAQLLFL